MMQRFIEHIEEDELEEKMGKLREDRVRDAFESYLLAFYLSQIQNYSGQGNNTADPLILIKELVDAGKMAPVPSLDANGNKVVRYELTPLWQTLNGNIYHNFDVAKIARILKGIYERNTEILLRCIGSRGGMEKMGMNLSKSALPLEANSTEHNN